MRLRYDGGATVVRGCDVHACACQSSGRACGLFTAFFPVSGAQGSGVSREGRCACRRAGRRLAGARPAAAGLRCRGGWRWREVDRWTAWVYDAMRGGGQRPGLGRG